MQTHGNLAASSLWQPTELARRMLGERPSPVPPTRELWPPPEPVLSISTLQLAYQQDFQDEDLSPRRASSLSSQPYVPTTVPIDSDDRPRYCTVGTNTEPPQTILKKIKRLFRREDEFISFPTIQLSTRNMESQIQNCDEKPTIRAVNGIKKAISGAKYRVAPNADDIDSPKIVYDTSKPGDRMIATFGASKSSKWFKFPSKLDCSQQIRALQSFCGRRRRQSSQREPPRPPLQITQV